MLRKRYVILASFLLGLCSACSESGGNAKSKTAEPLRPAVAVEAATAKAVSLIEGVEVTGTLTPKIEAAVKAEVEGLAREVFVTEWVRVKKGDPLVRIDLREQEPLARRAEAALAGAKAGLMQAEVEQNRAERELKRMKELKESGLATRQALDDAETEAQAAHSRVDAARAQVGVAEEDLHQIRTRLAKGLVTAPIGGIVSERKVNAGDLIGEAGANPPLFHIVDNRVLNLTVTAPSTAMAGLRRGQTMEFTTDAFPGRTFTGTVKHINPSVSEADRSILVMAEVQNGKDELKGGLFVKGRIVTRRRDGVVLVSRDSLLNWDVAEKKAGLFVVEKDRARRREVLTGAVDKSGVEIVSGLKAGERYVARGAFNVRADDRLLIAAVQSGAAR